MPKAREAVVIGAGPNGLVAANLLADAGWDVLLLEAESAVGGAVKSDSDVADGFVHDTFSSFYPMAAVSPVIRKLRLEQHGLTWRRHRPFWATRCRMATGPCCTVTWRRLLGPGVRCGARRAGVA